MLGRIGVLLHPHDMQVSRPQIEWREPPHAVACCFPYIIALHKESIEVHNLYDTSSCIQTIAIPRTVAVTNHGHQLWTATPSRLYQLCQLSVAQQVSALVRAKQVPEALDLLQRDQNLTELQRNEELLRVHTEAGFVFFEDLDFQRAMRHFKQATPPLRSSALL